MKDLIRRTALTIAALAASLSAAAPARQALPAPVAQQQPAPPPARPAMWKVADADTTIYLFGTIHALPKGIEWFDGKIAAAFENSQELVTEIVETEPAQMQKAVLATGVLPAGKSLRDMLAPRQKADFEAALMANGLPVQTFDRMKPWYAAVFLSTLPILQGGFDPANGVEQALSARGKALGRAHSALETAEYQLGLFDSLLEDVQLRYLGEVVENMPEARNVLTKMVEAWKRGDAATLARMMNEEEDDPVLLERLLTNRNKAWAEWIGKRLDRPGTVFLAVGAGHLAGGGSVQDQLASKGIAAARVQ